MLEVMQSGGQARGRRSWTDSVWLVSFKSPAGGNVQGGLSHFPRPSVKNEWLHVETTLGYLTQAPHLTDM